MRTKLFFGIICLCFLLGFTGCNNDDDPGMIWEYSPFEYRIYVHNLEGRNLLDPNTEGNILDKEIFITYKGERIDATYGWPDSPLTRLIPSEWYGIFIAPAFSSYGPDTGNSLFIGEFDGTIDDKFELSICGNVYELQFKSTILKDHSLKREYFFNGHPVTTCVYYLRFNDNLKDINYSPLLE